MNILVTGANGQVGNDLKLIAKKYPKWTFFWTDKESLNITSEKDINAFFSSHIINYCINCAAYTAVDTAESDVEIAELINVTAVQYLAEACAVNNAKLLQLSTDYVYHNSQNSPFVETDETNPQGVYARTKLEGENIAFEKYPKGTCVIRTSWVYSSFGHNFVKTMLKLASSRDKLTVIFDQIGTPTYAHDLAEAILEMISKIENKEVNDKKWNGIYHYSNEGVTTWYDFAKAIFELKNIDCEVLPIESKDYPSAAARPPFSLLNKNKIKGVFKLKIPYWRDSLKSCLDLL